MTSFALLIAASLGLWTLVWRARTTARPQPVRVAAPRSRRR